MLKNKLLTCILNDPNLSVRQPPINDPKIEPTPKVLKTIPAFFKENSKPWSRKRLKKAVP